MTRLRPRVPNRRADAGRPGVDLLLRLRQARWNRQRLRAPRCPSGWTIGPPDFVGVGTLKCGTTWWYRLIRRHPDVVARGHPKELRYFTRLGDHFTAADADAYAYWFPRPKGKVTGEWTPGYAREVSSVRSLSQAAPDAKLLLMLRDPIARYRSDVTMNAHVRNVEDAAARRGQYATHLANLLAFFERERILILQTERCVSDLRTELARTYRFLGLDPSFVPKLASRGVHVTTRPFVTVPDDRVQELVAYFEPEMLEVSRLAPEVDLSLWPSTRGLA